jgi:flagellar biosynthesis GTPase FlhF
MLSKPEQKLQPIDWLRRVIRREAVRGRHAILHGNIRDRFLIGEELMTLQEALHGALTHFGYDLVVDYNVADGLKPHGEAVDDLPKLLENIRNARAAARQRQQPAAANPSESQAAINTLRSVLPSPRAAGVTETLRDIAGLLAQSERTVACVVEAADRLVAGALHTLSEDGQVQLAILEGALEDAAYVTQPEGGIRRNLMILLVEDLSQLAGFLYTRSNPHVVPIAVGLPDTPTRTAVLRRSFSEVSGHLDEHEERAVVELGRMSDGMPLWDVAALSYTARDLQIPLTETNKLLARHRYGDIRNPWVDLMTDPSRVREIRQALGRMVFGQDRAVDAVARVVERSVAGLGFESDPLTKTRRPRGAVLFVGPTGVGKTELAKALAAWLFGTEASLAVFDMSEYQERHAVHRLIGAPPSYVGHEAGGALTNRVRAQPFSVLLFDEIDKAADEVFDVFLQILAEGRLTDGQGQTANFADSVVIFTSNEGARDRPAVQGDDSEARDTLSAHYRDAVKRRFRPEFIGRVGEGNIISFNGLAHEARHSIAEKTLSRLAHNLREVRSLDVHFADSVIQGLVETSRSATDEYGGRAIEDAVGDLVIAPLSTWLISGASDPMTSDHLTFDVDLREPARIDVRWQPDRASSSP